MVGSSRRQLASITAQIQHNYVGRMHHKRLLRIRAAVLLLIGAITAPSLSINLPQTAPATAGMSAERLARMDSVIRESIDKKELPGAIVLVARHRKVIWRKAYGARAIDPQRETM